MRSTRVPRFRAIRRLWPRSRELLRPTDRVELTVLVVALLATLVLLPVALAVGSEVYVRGARLAEQQSTDRHSAVAILTEPAPAVVPAMRGGYLPETSMVAARWQVPGGGVRTGAVAAANGSSTGTRVQVWLNPAGDVVPAPMTEGGAIGAAAAATVGLWGAGAALFAALYLAVRVALDRYRLARWQREWAASEPNWTHRAT